ncbi:MAG: TetR/AcrR family transcriptional regulator C-terminal domain-containing protein [Bacillales bacterium]|nr:TetR/AcrR family transcriptional regulator C-terminal domain-containing protein [Bacillales bacterium]
MDRKEFTKRCLAEALIELLKEHEYHEISINDITNKSGFSRMSYYRNFKSVDEILDYFLDIKTTEHIENTNLNFDELPLEEYMIRLFNFLGSPACREISSLLIKRGLFDHVQKQFDRRFRISLPRLKSYYYSFISGGIFNAYKLWVCNGYSETPEEIVQSFFQFSRFSNFSFLE